MPVVIVDVAKADDIVEPVGASKGSNVSNNGCDMANTTKPPHPAIDSGSEGQLSGSDESIFEESSDEDGFDDEAFLQTKGERRNFVGSTSLSGGIGSSTHLSTQRIIARLNMDPSCHAKGSSTDVSHSVLTSLKKSERKAEAPRSRGLTRDTRATVEQVLDPRTIQILEKMLKWNVFTELFGCISTGKEANVYLGIATSGDSRFLRAIKVFKTSILVFKDRARYVDGEFRFRRGYAGNSNPRKMVRQWAEKEFRNLRRITIGCLRCPIPVELRSHVIAMSFLGTSEGTASPRLKELTRLRPPLPQASWRRIYVEVIATLRCLFQECKLVHGDFSEYNILFHEGHPYVIDVSQAVEGDHPRALDFLKRDCVNITRFFEKVLTGGSSDSDSAGDQDERTLATASPLEGCPSDADVERKSAPSGVAWSSQLKEHCHAEEDICGSGLLSEWRLLPIQRLFDFITRPDFIQVEEGRESAWVEFDIEERERAVDAATVATERPPVQPPNKTKSTRKTKGSQPQHIASQAPTGRVAVESTCLDTTSTSEANPPSKPAITDAQGRLAKQRSFFLSLCVATLAFLQAHNAKELTATEGERNQMEVEELVFLNTWTPSNLQQISTNADLEREQKRQELGLGICHLVQAKGVDKEEALDGVFRATGADVSAQASASSIRETDSDGTSSLCGNEDDAESKSVFTGIIPEGMDPKVWKRLVKEQKRERRKTKIPKALKKKKTAKRCR